MSLSWAEVDSGTYGNPELSDQLRFAASKMMSLYELVTPGDDLFIGKKSGDSVAFKLAGPITGTSETALSEFQKVPMATIPQYEVSATVYRRGLAVPFTKLREDLDRLTVEDAIIHALKEHSARTHQKVIYDALVAGRSFCYTPTSASAGNFTTNGSPSGTAAADLSAFHLRKIKLNLTKYNTPYADGENYHAVFSPTAIMNLFNDGTSTNTGFVDVKKYAAGGADGLLKGELGTYMKIRIMEDNYTDVLSDSIGSGSAYGSGFICGFDACREVLVYPMELLANTNLGGDFGQQKAIAWLSCLSYKTVWNYTTHGQGAVCHYTTA